MTELSLALRQWRERPFHKNFASSKFCFVLFFVFPPASNIVLMSDKAVLVDFGLSVQMTEDVYIPRDLRGTEVRGRT